MSLLDISTAEIMNHRKKTAGLKNRRINSRSYELSNQQKKLLFFETTIEITNFLLNRRIYESCNQQQNLQLVETTI